MSKNDIFSPGSHPHSDRPNWRPAETIEDYIRNCRESLEQYSDRRMAKLLGIPRVQLWRWQLMAELPEGLLDRLFEAARKRKRPTSTKELAHIALALRRGLDAFFQSEAECCPHCGEVLRVRRPFGAEMAWAV